MTLPVSALNHPESPPPSFMAIDVTIAPPPQLAEARSAHTPTTLERAHLHSERSKITGTDKANKKQGITRSDYVSQVYQNGTLLLPFSVEHLGGLAPLLHPFSTEHPNNLLHSLIGSSTASHLLLSQLII